MDPTARTILDEARAQIARGGEPDADALEARIRAAGDDAEPALAQLRRILAVHRARRAVAAGTPTPPAPRPRQRAEYRATPTIAANMAVRARSTGDTVTLEWDALPAVAEWQARVSERPDARSPYVEREHLVLDSPRLELRLTDGPRRVHLLGRNAAGRLVQRAVISGLTRSNWSQRWVKRATAS